jgi:hypothetical protein
MRRTLLLIAGSALLWCGGLLMVGAQEPKGEGRQPPLPRVGDNPPPRRDEGRGPGFGDRGPDERGPGGPGRGFGPGGPGPGDRGPGDRPPPPPGGPFGGPPRGPGMGPPQDWRRLEEDDPEMYALMKADYDMEQKCLDISRRLRQLPSDQRVKSKEELTKLLNEHFDVRQKRRELQIKRMDEELQKLREAVTKRNEARDSLVRKRLSELTGEESDQDF